MIYVLLLCFHTYSGLTCLTQEFVGESACVTFGRDAKALLTSYIQAWMCRPKDSPS